MCGPSGRRPLPTIDIKLPAFGWWNFMMSEVIEIGYYRDNVLLTYYAIEVLEKKVRQKTGMGSLYLTFLLT